MVLIKYCKKYKSTTNSNHNLPVAENLLNRDFTVNKPNQKWVSDITYVAADEGLLYLAGVIDLYDMAIVGFAMEEHMRRSLVIAALNNTIGRTGAKLGLLVHSDRVIQYSSLEYQAILNKNKFICNMSRQRQLV